ncbi:hypothetical protein ACFQ5B_20655, partial [Laceyella putida]
DGVARYPIKGMLRATIFYLLMLQFADRTVRIWIWNKTTEEQRLFNQLSFCFLSALSKKSTGE